MPNNGYVLSQENAPEQVGLKQHIWINPLLETQKCIHCLGPHALAILILGKKMIFGKVKFSACFHHKRDHMLEHPLEAFCVLCIA